MQKWKVFFEDQKPVHVQRTGKQIRQARVEVAQAMLEGREEELLEDPDKFFDIVIACTPVNGNDNDPAFIRTATLMKIMKWSLLKLGDYVEEMDTEGLDLLTRTVTFMKASLYRENIWEMKHHNN